MHSAKGREFSVVIIPFFVESNFPFYTSAMESYTKRDRRLEEERRLTYVALSRARELVLLFSLRSYKGLPCFQNSKMCRKPSTFISDMKPYVQDKERDPLVPLKILSQFLLYKCVFLRLKKKNIFFPSNKNYLIESLSACTLSSMFFSS